MTMYNFTPRKLLLPASAMLPVLAMGQSTTQRPNIMLIVVDDMGYSDLGCYGGEVQTPNIDNLAENGVRFSQFYNSGRSCPSRACLLTGLYAQQAGITGMGQSLNNNCVTLAEVLKDAGYHTAMSGKWHLSLTVGIGNKEDQMKWLSHQDFFDREFAPLSSYPCNRGFEEHWGTIWGVVNHFDPFSLVHNETPIYTDSIPSDFYSTDFITQKAIDMLDTLSTEDKPFFMYVAYNAPHWPLHAKPADIAKYKGKFDDGWEAMRQRRYKKLVELGIIDSLQTPNANNESNRKWEDESNQEMQAADMEVHAAMVDCVDQGVGKIIQELKDKGVYDNTVIIFTSDNGASPENYEIGDFDRHDRLRNGDMVTRNAQVPGDDHTYNYLGTGWAGAVNTPYRYWKAESFHGGTAAPTIIVWPNGLKAEKGSILSAPCAFIDIMPTCLELAGATYPTTYNNNSITPLPKESRSLTPLLNGNKQWDDERTLFWEHENGKAVRVGNWKMTALRNGGWQLFDLSKDLSETNNIAPEYPDKVKELRKLWNEWAESVGLTVTDTIEDTEKELLFYYPFDGTLEDKSGNNYQLTDHGSAFSTGKVNDALSLNGDAQYVDFSNPGVLNPQQSQFTICCWLYNADNTIPTSGTVENNNYFKDDVVISQKDNNGTGRILLYTRTENPVSGGDVSRYFDNFLSNRHNKSTPNAHHPGEWQHIAVVCNPVVQSVTFYINGVRDTTISTGAFETCQGGLRIGGHKADKNYWNGMIDELYCFKGLLSADEIKQIYNNTYLTKIDAITSQRQGLIYNADNKTIESANGKSYQYMTLYTTAGQQVKQVRNSGILPLDSLSHGVYVLKAKNHEGEVVSLKLMI